MTMRGVRRTLGIAVCCVVLSLGGAAAEEAAEEGGRHVLDEFAADVQRGDDTFRLALGMNWGDTYDNGFYWFRGARISWLKLFEPGDTLSGWSLGGVIGLGHRPERTVSPIFSFVVDRPFGVDSRYDWLGQVSAGARIRVVPRLPQHYAIGFSVIHTEVLGSGGVPDISDTGIAIHYSMAIFERK